MHACSFSPVVYTIEQHGKPWVNAQLSIGLSMFVYMEGRRDITHSSHHTEGSDPTYTVPVIVLHQHHFAP